MEKTITPLKVDVCIFDCAIEDSLKQSAKQLRQVETYKAELKSGKTGKQLKRENEDHQGQGDFFVPEFDMVEVKSESPKPAKRKNRSKSRSKERRGRIAPGSPSPRKRSKRQSSGAGDGQVEVAMVMQVDVNTTGDVDVTLYDDFRSTTLSRSLKSKDVDNSSTTRSGIDQRTTVSENAQSSSPGSVYTASSKPHSFQPQAIPLPSSRKLLYKVKSPAHSDSVHTNSSKHREIGANKVPSGVILHLGHPQKLGLRGKVTLSVLYGRVSLLGHVVTCACQPVEVYSPTCTSLMFLSTEPTERETTDLSNVNELKSRLENLMLPSSEMKALLTEVSQSSVLVFLQKLSNMCCDYATTVLPFRQLFGRGLRAPYHEEYRCNNEVLQTLGVQIVPADQSSRQPVVNVSADFHHIRDIWFKALQDQGEGKKCKLLSCGGKNTGKSTLNRFLVNSTLQRMGCVCYLDCDIGQTEFNPPGCVALHVISKPILGPPFTHQRDPAFVCFYGGVNAGDNPSMYSQCVKRVYNKYETCYSGSPLIINTMGWNKGLGVSLLTYTCDITRPDLIVQLESRNQANNLPAITLDFLSSHRGIFNRKMSQDEAVKPFTHTLTIIDSPVQPSIESQLRFLPKDHRNLSILGYFSRCLKDGLYTNLQSVQPYKVPWSNLALAVSHMAVPPSEILSALNASIVGLCVADHSSAHRPADHPELPLQFRESPVCQCLGMGIVRGVDMEEKMFYIITPLDPSTLLSVNTLIRGVTNIPEELLIKQKSKGEVPYMDTHLTVTGASSVRPRRYMPRQQYQAQKTAWL